MAFHPVGNQWLKQHLGLAYHRLTHRSFIGTRNKTEVNLDGTIDETYGPKYAPKEDSLAAHIEFSLKYDDLNLDFLAAVFYRTEQNELIDFISGNPTGRYTRKMGFLYEWLTGKRLAMMTEATGNYVDLLDSSKYITGATKRNSRWKINDNLLGVPQFCPIVRRTPALAELLSIDIKAQLEQLKAGYPPEVFNRATQYLYRKETKSSYEIENEKPSPDRMNRFIAILHDAGKQPTDQLLAEKELTALQNAIVDPRYAQSGYRDFQNYIGQSNYRMEEIYHYVCPPPNLVRPMMEGMLATEKKSMVAPPMVRAAIISFGFVFIHPFLDGNGRIHRFLIHDMLTRDGLVGQGSIIPVSARMVNNLKDYDLALEAYSKPLMQRIQFVNDPRGELTVTNPDEVVTYFRYPDLTIQSVYLANTLRATIQYDLFEELLFLEQYDELKRALQQIIDMPDKRLNEIIIFLHQNKGIFPNRRRKQFQEVTPEEFSNMEIIYAEIFAL